MSKLENPSESTPRHPSIANRRDDARLLGACLKVLIAHYDLAEAEYERASKLCYTLEFKALIASDLLTEEMRYALAEQREEETGFDRAVEDRSELARAQVLAFVDEILELESTSPDVLALKASGCLWERPAEQMEGDGGKRAAVFLSRLAALQ